MKYNFCTLFDSYYLTRGLALYQSLLANCKDFHIYIFSFDNSSYTYLCKLNLEKATIISLSDFEDISLLNVKSSRSIAEYCWTCTASTIWYSIKKFNLDYCTYLDADMFFFSSPDPIFQEIGQNSIGITPHNFAPKLKSSLVYGKYCVQFVFFRNDFYGLEALEWWRNSCIDWCYARFEDGKYGDQKYLDYFEEKFQNVKVIEHTGAGLAPWNVDCFFYHINKDNNLIINSLNNKQSTPLIFYHFQGLKFKLMKQKIIAEASKIKIPKIILSSVYTPYISQLAINNNEIKGIDNCVYSISFNRKFKDIIMMFIKINIKQFYIIRKIHSYTRKFKKYHPKGIEF